MQLSMFKLSPSILFGLRPHAGQRADTCDGWLCSEGLPRLSTDISLKLLTKSVEPVNIVLRTFHPYPYHHGPRSITLLPPKSRTIVNTRRWRSFLRSNGTVKIGFFSTAFFLTGLIVYLTFLSPNTLSWGLPDWHLPPHLYSDSRTLADHNETLLVNPIPTSLLPTPTPESAIPDDPPPPSPSSPVSDVLTLEQIRDIVAPTRGFFSRDFPLGLGWNNVRYVYEAALLQAELLNRTLVLPSFVYARACEYNITVCADYATMVNKGDAVDSEEWRELPIEEQMGFRIPISVIVNMTNLRIQQPVITASEYLRLHGQDPESESSSGFWPREWYHTHTNVFETNKTKIPSLFLIENHWYAPLYGPEGTTRVDYIPEAMKRRGNLERHPGPDYYDGTAEYWPTVEATELSGVLYEAMLERGSSLEWDNAKEVLVNCSDLIGDVNLDDDEVVEELLNAHGWEVLHTFPSILGMDFTKIVVGHIRQVVTRSSIRGFKDDYYDVDADVVILTGLTHLGTKPGAMRFTEDLSRRRYASKVVHSLVSPQKFLDLAEVLSSRMLLRTGGRMWMGAHVRRTDFRVAMEAEPEDHIQRVKNRLEAGRNVLIDLHKRDNWTSWDIESVRPYPEHTTLPPPRSEDPFFVATDERDPETLRIFARAGAVFMFDLLTMEDRQTFGWQLMFTDLMAIVEQRLLVRSGYFYGHSMSSFSGVIMSMRAGAGADPRTMLID
ncbi:hypothetical protein EI94DRAFT_1731800 [Lactarius quietus]|nr:hypothetical protein EI94DRAFT_1731800 [Lactarius quietus]